MGGKVIRRGAEAIIFLASFEGRQAVVKERVKKGYRIPRLDESLRKARTRMEAGILIKAIRAGISVPKVISSSDFSIVMERIEGPLVREIINEKNAESLGRQAGTEISRLHSFGLIHGDLTASNMIVSNGIRLIDFGLAKASSRVEDKASDIFVLYETMRASKPSIFPLFWKGFAGAYASGKDAVLRQLEKVERRRRYKPQD
ncbi:MAG: Kae1-associated serine/threonine protein kinase [Candidatus Aenigmarchaeota archaeon]|nr:Kae1-associated serine/threonine protein kinase [Candidatus Aenigmarchaeota archaeon]